MMHERREQFLADAKALRLTAEERSAVWERIVQEMGMVPLSEEIRGAGERYRLTGIEKAEGLHALIAHMRAHPLMEENDGFFSSFFRSLNAHRLLATSMASFLIVFSLGGSLAYAAESALPGDLLYPMKVGVVEPVRGAFKRTREQRDAWRLEQLERRLEEAEALVILGRMNEEAWREVQERIDHQMVLMEEHVREPPEFGSDEESVQDAEDRVRRAALRTSLERTLEKHERRFTSSVEEKPVERPARAVLESVRSHRVHVKDITKQKDTPEAVPDDDDEEEAPVSRPPAAQPSLVPVMTGSTVEPVRRVRLPEQLPPSSRIRHGDDEEELPRAIRKEEERNGGEQDEKEQDGEDADSRAEDTSRKDLPDTSDEEMFPLSGAVLKIPEHLPILPVEHGGKKKERGL